MNKYQQIEFDKLSDAIAFIEDGGVIYQLDAGHGYELAIETLAKSWPMRGLFTDAPKPKWYEKLDGKVENGVLCRWTDEFIIAISFDEEWKRIDDAGGLGYAAEDVTPLTRTEIQRFLNNAPE